MVRCLVILGLAMVCPTLVCGKTLRVEDDSDEFADLTLEDPIDRRSLISFEKVTCQFRETTGDYKWVGSKGCQKPDGTFYNDGGCQKIAECNPHCESKCIKLSPYCYWNAGLGTCLATSSPTMNPTVNPTTNPTGNPTARPTASPSASPSTSPTVNPTANPTTSPTANPSEAPTTQAPTIPPTTLGAFCTYESDIVNYTSSGSVVLTKTLTRPTLAFTCLLASSGSTTFYFEFSGPGVPYAVGISQVLNTSAVPNSGLRMLTNDGKMLLGDGETRDWAHSSFSPQDTIRMTLNFVTELVRTYQNEQALGSRYLTKDPAFYDSTLPWHFAVIFDQTSSIGTTVQFGYRYNS